METILIGIHGLRNKPSKYLLTKWWKAAIIEGFRIVNMPEPRFSLEMAYWAQYMHTRPQDPQVDDRNDPRFLLEPYIAGHFFGPRDPRNFRKQLKADIHQQLMQMIAGESGFMNYETISNRILRRMFEELDTYYHGSLKDELGAAHPARELIRGELIRLLKRHQDKNICLLAHSMGSIIAYDVLMHENAGIPVHTLLTFGSPLGFPVIRNKIKQELSIDENEEISLPTPEAITHRWMNFSDLDDETCLNYNLRYHFHANESGVRPFDRIVYNNYEHNGAPNPHKAYGYLRTLDITQALNTFLVIESSSFSQRLHWLFKPPPVI
jgi:hypothetical protein